ncbi:NAD(P)/FAD-dependent oxidoreductase [Janibacter sp. LM]|uniref:NAD(P)/FAD-dependent oxidoreductase n=1 Tax=Janibacter sp. LM TaxID=3144845 RepID=UPI0031F602A1
MRPRHHVLVVGGGIAGLALAAALDPRRVHVTLVEERPERAGHGTVLALWRGGRSALDDLGVGETVRRTALPVERAALRSADGAPLVARRDLPLWFVPRRDLVTALEAGIPPSVTRTTRQVTDPRALAAEVGADLVVGADGVRSVCRQQAFEGSAPVVTEWIALRGHLPGPPTTSATEWWGPDGLFGTTPGPQGAAWFCAVRADHRGVTVDPAEAVAAARGHFGDWDLTVRDVLARVGDAADVQRVLLAPPMRTIVDDGLVLVGDAAHAMSPNLGRGANEALRDAVVLAEEIHRRGTKGAPLAYSRRRHASGQVLRLTATVALRAATSRRGRGVRDRALRLVP